MIMPGDLVPRDQSPSEVVAMIKRELDQRQVGSGSEIHIHYHAGPAQAPAPDTRATSDPMAPAARLAPYFMILLGGAIILAIIGVITIMLVPAIMALATTLAIIACGIAIMFVAVAASIRSLRYSRADVQMARRRSRR